MTLNVLIVTTIYFLIGLFIAGFYMAFDEFNTGMFILMLFLWPIVFVVIAFIVVMVIPVVVGKWFGDRIKRWF